MRIMLALGVVTFCLGRLQSASAADTAERFVEFPYVNATKTYDLETVEIVQPGRFTIISTMIDNRDLMNLRLKTLDALRAYCDRKDGEYQPSVDVLALWSPDLPIIPISVQSSPPNTPGEGVKTVVWKYPYKKLVLNNGERDWEILFCKGRGKTKTQWYLDHKNDIMNGYKKKELFDCKRGVTGFYTAVTDDPSKPAVAFMVSAECTICIQLCRAVTGKWPDLPDK